MDIYQGPLEGIKGLLIYKLAKIEFCSDVTNVVAIINIDEIKQKLKNDLLPQIEYDRSEYKLINLQKIYGLKSEVFTINTRIILNEMFGKRFCFLVDEVIEILTTDRIFIDKFLDFIPYSEKNFISSILKFQNRKIYLPDFEKITKEFYRLTKSSRPDNYDRKNL